MQLCLEDVHTGNEFHLCYCACNLPRRSVYSKDTWRRGSPDDEKREALEEPGMDRVGSGSPEKDSK